MVEWTIGCLRHANQLHLAPVTSSSSYVDTQLFTGVFNGPCADNTIEALSLHFNGHFPGEPGLAGVY